MPDSPFDNNLLVKRIPYLDALKGLAILGVVLFHATSFSLVSLPHWLEVITSQGARGVQLFFIISAISLSYFWSKSPTLNWPTLKQFYLKRWLRLIPLYYLALIFWLMVLPNSLSLSNIAVIFLLLNAWFPYLINAVFPGSWFVPIAFLFSLLFPFLFNLFKNIPRGLILVVSSMLLCQGIRTYLLTHPLINNSVVWSDFTFISLPSQLPVFLMGLVLYQIISKRKLAKQEKISLGIFSVLLIALLIIQYTTNLKLIAGHYLYSLVFCCGIFALSQKPVSLLINKATVALGKESYGIYLTHMLILYLFSTLHLFPVQAERMILSFGLRFLAVLGVSFLLFTVINKYVLVKVQAMWNQKGESVSGSNIAKVN